MTQSDRIADNIQDVATNFENNGIDGGQIIAALTYLIDSKINMEFKFNRAYYEDIFPAYAREKAEELFDLHFPKKRRLPF